MDTREQKLADILKKAQQGVKDVFESEKFRNYLTVMSKFHSYSASNNLLILMQKPEATHVAGYATWKNEFKRQVQQGEKGIQIIAYTPQKINVTIDKKDSAGNVILGADNLPVQETVSKEKSLFQPVYVFDVSQTTGEPLPQLVNELSGNVNAYQDLLQVIQEVSPFPITFDYIAGAARGFCDPTTQQIVIKQGMSEAQSIKTALHEVTHANLHAPQMNLASSDRTDQRTREIEAESTAFVVCSHYGIDTSDYTFPYLASWSSTKELKELQNSLDTIQKQAGALIKEIDTRLAEIQQTQTIQQSAEIPDQKEYYKTFYSGAGGQDKEAHDFHKETGWNMAWGSDNSGLNGDTWILYRHISDLPKQFKKIVPTLQHEPAIKAAAEIPASKEQISMKDRIASAQAAANRYNNDRAAAPIAAAQSKEREGL